MVGDKKRPRDAPPHKARQSRDNGDNAGESSKAAAPRAAPSFVSSLQNEEGDFPRGGGTSLTAFEMKQVREEGRREADEEAAAEVCLQSLGRGSYFDWRSDE
jgi:rRNA biogenesis protein RRP5